MVSSSSSISPGLEGIFGCKSPVSIFSSSSSDPKKTFSVLDFVSRIEGFSFDTWEATTAAAEAISVVCKNFDNQKKTTALEAKTDLMGHNHPPRRETINRSQREYWGRNRKRNRAGKFESLIYGFSDFYFYKSNLVGRQLGSSGLKLRE
jgi:hypothetical protein